MRESKDSFLPVLALWSVAMLVKINFGPRCGELQDLAPEAARALLADGRASWPVEDQRPAETSPELKATPRKSPRRR